jgi:O-antigen/teichoic acid export membrane protein
MVLISLSIAGIAAVHLLVAANEKKKLSDNGLSLNRKAAFKASTGLTLIAVISGSDSYIFTLLAGQIGGSDYAGAFFSSIRTTEAVNLFLMAITLVYANKLSKAVAKKDFKELQSLCNALMILQIVPVLAVSAIIILFNTEIISFFSPEYSKYTTTLNLLVAGIIFNALTGSTVLLMQLLGLHWRQILLQGGFLVGAAAFALALSSFTDPEIVALSYLVAKVGWNYFAIKNIKNTCGVNPSIAAIFGSKRIPFSSVKSELLNKLRE